MKKASKVLVLLLAVIMILGVFSGCGVFGRNTEKYRETVALKIGNEEIKIGKLIDTFNSYYNSYASYISQGYMTVDSVFEMALSSLYSQYMKLDAYKNTADVPTYTHSDIMNGTEKVTFANQQYLDNGSDKVDELQYAIKYVKYILFTSLDAMVEGYAEIEYELKDAEQEDTSRDFLKYDDLGDAQTYSEYSYLQNFTSKEMDEYLEKYYGDIVKSNTVTVDEYVYAAADKDSAVVQKRLSDLNERVDGDEKITFEKYREWQQDALTQYKKSVSENYKYDLETLVKRQVEDFIVSVIVAKYNYNVYKAIDNDNKETTIADLKKEYEAVKASQLAGFNINNNYVSFIEGLTSTSYIYDIPKDSSGKPLYQYIYVKNLLIPFSTEQTNTLSNLEKELGSKTDARYLEVRNKFAEGIVAEDFTQQDADGKNVKYENLFQLVETDGESKLVVKEGGELATYLKDGKVLDTTNPAESFRKLMERFNTDTAQHSAMYEYVVRMGDYPKNYTAKWVQEFVDAAKEAYALSTDKTGGTYAIAVSSYGVHIVYYSADVTAQTFDFDELLTAGNIKDMTNTPAYRMYKTYYDTQSKKVLEADMESLQKKYYLDENNTTKITKTAELDKFLKENGIKFDFNKSITIEDEAED